MENKVNNHRLNTFTLFNGMDEALNNATVTPTMSNIAPVPEITYNQLRKHILSIKHKFAQDVNKIEQEYLVLLQNEDVNGLRSLNHKIINMINRFDKIITPDIYLLQESETAIFEDFNYLLQKLQSLHNGIKMRIHLIESHSDYNSGHIYAHNSYMSESLGRSSPSLNLSSIENLMNSEQFGGKKRRRRTKRKVKSLKRKSKTKGKRRRRKGRTLKR